MKTPQSYALSTKSAFITTSNTRTQSNTFTKYSCCNSECSVSMPEPITLTTLYLYRSEMCLCTTDSFSTCVCNGRCWEKSETAWWHCLPIHENCAFPVINACCRSFPLAVGIFRSYSGLLFYGLCLYHLFETIIKIKLLLLFWVNLKTLRYNWSENS